jgi:hypothetical protein
VQGVGLDVHQPAAAGARAPARLLDEEGDGAGLVEQAQPACPCGVLAVARVQEDPAAHQDAVGLGHERGDPAHVEVMPARPGLARQAFVHIALHGRLPEAAVGGIDRELGGLLGQREVGVAEHPFAELRVQRERVGAAAQREHEHGGRAVDGIARADLAGAGLQEIAGLRVLARRGSAQHREDAAHRHVHVDVGGAVQRVEQEQVFAARVLRRQRIRRFQFLGQHASQVSTPFAGAQEHVVGQHVQGLLLLALHIAGAGAAEHIGQRPVGHLAGDGLAGERHVGDERVEFAGGIGVAASLLDEELGEGGTSSGGHVGLLVVLVNRCGAGLEPGDEFARGIQAPDVVGQHGGRLAVAPAGRRRAGPAAGPPA